MRCLIYNQKCYLIQGEFFLGQYKSSWCFLWTNLLNSGNSCTFQCQVMSELSIPEFFSIFSLTFLSFSNSFTLSHSILFFCCCFPWLAFFPIFVASNILLMSLSSFLLNIWSNHLSWLYFIVVLRWRFLKVHWIFNFFHFCFFFYFSLKNRISILLSPLFCFFVFVQDILFLLFLNIFFLTKKLLLYSLLFSFGYSFIYFVYYYSWIYASMNLFNCFAVCLNAMLSIFFLLS